MTFTEPIRSASDGVVRCIAMGTSDGLSRNLEVTDLGHPIEVPVGVKTLGRIMNVLGDPIDMKGDIGAEEKWSIHRAAPTYEERLRQEALDFTGTCNNQFIFF